MRAQSQYLRIYDAGGTTYQRWQSYYANEGGYYESEKIRFLSGYPQKIGGWVSDPTVSINSTIGVSIKNTSGTFVPIFGGNVVDIGLEVR